jgi:F420-non-reducing hydrogenase large subunit
MYAVLGGKPVHATLATHWARLIEALYAAERMVELLEEDEIASDHIRNVPTAIPEEGVGIVEAPRGTLIHHYQTDERGLLTGVSLIVATNHNAAPIAMSVEKAAKGLIQGGKVSDGLLNMVEMAFRAYDPCHACATHAIGETPMVIEVRSRTGTLLERIVRD